MLAVVLKIVFLIALAYTSTVYLIITKPYACVDVLFVIFKNFLT